MKWLYKLEYKHGKHYIRNLMLYIVGGMAIAYVLQMIFAFDLIGSYGLLALVPAEILRGQVWRLVTFIFVPSGGNLFFLVFLLYFYYMMGNMLESVWGGFRLNVYYLVGVLATIASAFVAYIFDPMVSVPNSYLNLSLFLAVAVIAPDTQFLFFFLIPIKAKWLALVNVGLNVINLIWAFRLSVLNGLSMLVVFGFSMLNFFLFFGRSLIETVGNQIRIQKNRRNWRR